MSEEQAMAQARELIQKNRVFLFMKGSPNFPQCGFSGRAVGLLRQAGADFGHFDILADPDMRAAVKVLGSWPTFPQLYVDGELVGGSDILAEMAASGELASLLGPQGQGSPSRN